MSSTDKTMPRSFLVKKTKHSSSNRTCHAIHVDIGHYHDYDVPSQAASTPKSTAFGSYGGISVRLNNGKSNEIGNSMCVMGKRELYLWMIGAYQLHPTLLLTKTSSVTLLVYSIHRISKYLVRPEAISNAALR